MVGGKVINFPKLQCALCPCLSELCWHPSWKLSDLPRGLQLSLAHAGYQVAFPPSSPLLILLAFPDSPSNNTESLGSQTDLTGLLFYSRLWFWDCAHCATWFLKWQIHLYKGREGLGDRLGWKCTMHLEWRHTSDWFMTACLRVFIGNTKHSPLIQFKEMENSRSAGERSFWAHMDGYKFQK